MVCNVSNESVSASGRIEDLIMTFARDRISIRRPCFHKLELTHYVSQREPSTAIDVESVLRDLRKRKQLDYKVTQAKLSLFEITSVRSAS